MYEKEIVDDLKKSLVKKNIEFSEEIFINSARADLIINKKIVIEAKIRDINKAILQLIAYKRQYKICYLYMPLNKRRLVLKNSDLLNNLGIRWFFYKGNGRYSFGKPYWRKALFQ